MRCLGGIDPEVLSLRTTVEPPPYGAPYVRRQSHDCYNVD